MNIYHQSVFEKWLIEDNSIQTIITSPPYWGLRKYDIPDIMIDSWKGQYGLELSYRDYIQHTLLWCQEAWRVLKDDGIFFLNIGDSYSAHKDCKQVAQSVSIGKPSEMACVLSKGDSPSHNSKQLKLDSMKNKCKMLIPHRIAIELIEKGWILRNDILWEKGNCMPESVKDRFSKRFEYIFMFVKNEKYYFDLDAIREKQSESTIKRAEYAIRINETYENRKEIKLGHEHIGSSPIRLGRKNMLSNTLIQGKNPGDAWQINTQPSSIKHYAQWPEKLVERMLLCSTKENDLILDPFCGSGTTLKVAIRNNRQAVGIDLGYSDIQERKLKDIQKCLV